MGLRNSIRENSKPRWSDWLVSFVCKERYAEEILGDLEEYYCKLQTQAVRFKNLRFAYQTLQFLRVYALKTPFQKSNSITMVKMNLKIAVRNLRREKFYSFINIFGLALGIATCLFIGIFIKDEMNYDEHWSNAGRIYRVVGHLRFMDNEFELATTPAPMSAAFKKDFPEIGKAGRMRNVGSNIVEINKQMIKVPVLAYADQEIFEIFSFETIAGVMDLTDRNTMVVSATMAQKLFGKQDVVGESVKMGDTNFEIRGVYQDIPDNTHFHYDVMASMENWGNSTSTEWGSNNFRTYFLLDEGYDFHELEAKFASVYPKYFGPMLKAHANATWEQFVEAGSFVDYYLQPIERIHLHSDLSYEIEQNGSFQYIILFGAAGLFVLIIACINFMNISTARTSNRAKEVGMRKVLGSTKRYLINQFMMESILNAVIASLLSIGLIYALLPYFNQLTDKQVTDPLFGDLFLFPWVLMGTIIVGLLAGIYPALFLSSFRPIRVLKGELRLGARSGWMRNGLVIVQFSTSIVLIFGAVVISSQLGYIQSKALGFSKDQVLILQNTYMMGNQIDAFIEEIKDQPAVLNATMTSFLPTGNSRSDSPLLPKANTTDEEFVSLQMWRVDPDYIPTMDLKLIAGRNFERDLASDSNAVILNKAAVEKFGFEQPVGELLRSMRGFSMSGISEFKVIGVIDDFHYDSFKENIDPMVLLNIRSTGSIAVKFEPGRTTEVLASLDRLWSDFNTNLPFEYTFMDQEFEAKYRSEQKLSTLFTLFSSLAIFIACLGLFGLAAFTADQRKKEIGIRKVLGATLGNLMIRQLSGYTKLLIVAMLLSLPLGIYLMSEWLDNFVFRTEINAIMVIFPVLMVLLLAWTTVSIISFRSARQNPVDNLKYE